MAGIYIHIPFCRQACHYCNFHFATSLSHKNELLAALLKETTLRRDYFEGELVETVYFGGGTPSLLTIPELQSQLDAIQNTYSIAPGAEITLEANPDDISKEKLIAWKEIGINRLSIGIQSFFDEDLVWMHRAHNATQAIQHLELAREYFDNITMDLIYGTPGLTNEKWKSNVDRAISLGIPHLSCYALTVEPKTPLQKIITKGLSSDVDPDLQSAQFTLLMEWMAMAGYEHYEISNFARPGFRSRHNSSYWQSKKYLGLGPSAHSFNGESRQWNIANNSAYTRAIESGSIPAERELLTPIQMANEYIMTSLRTTEGLDIRLIDALWRNEVNARAQKFIDGGLLVKNGDYLQLTREGKLLADGIAADLFIT